MHQHFCSVIICTFHSSLPWRVVLCSTLHQTNVESPHRLSYFSAAESGWQRLVSTPCCSSNARVWWSASAATAGMPGVQAGRPRGRLAALLLLGILVSAGDMQGALPEGGGSVTSGEMGPVYATSAFPTTLQGICGVSRAQEYEEERPLVPLANDR